MSEVRGTGRELGRCGCLRRRWERCIPGILVGTGGTDKRLKRWIFGRGCGAEQAAGGAVVFFCAGNFADFTGKRVKIREVSCESGPGSSDRDNGMAVCIGYAEPGI